MRDLNDKVAWITGAGSGIGAGIALAYASAGMRLVLSGRREAELQNVAAQVVARGASARVAPLDVADARQLRFHCQWRPQAPAQVQRTGDAAQERGRHGTKLRCAPEQPEQQLPLRPGRDRRPRAADRQHTVATRSFVQAAGQVVGQVLVADRLAGGEPAVAEQQKGPTLLHPCHLA